MATTTKETKDTKKKTPTKKEEVAPPLPTKQATPLPTTPTPESVGAVGMDQMQQLYAQQQQQPMAGSTGATPMAGSPGTAPMAGSPPAVVPPTMASQTVDMSNAPYPNFSDMAQGDTYIPPGQNAPPQKGYDQATSPYAPKNLSNLAPGDTRPAEPYPETPFALKLMGAFLAPTKLGKIPDYIVQGIENKRTAMIDQDEKDFQHFMSVWKENPMAASQLAGTSMFNGMLERKLGMNAKDIKTIQEIAAENPYSASELTQLLTSEAYVPEQENIQVGGTKLKRNPARNLIKVEGQEQLYDAVNNKMIDPSQMSFDNFAKSYRSIYPNASDMEAKIAQMHFNAGDDMYDIVTHNGNIVVFNKANPKDNFRINASDPDVTASKNVSIEEVKGSTGGTLGFWVVNKGAQYTDEDGTVKYQHYFVPLKDLLSGIMKEQAEKGNPAPVDDPGKLRRWFNEFWDPFYKGFTGASSANYMDDQMLAWTVGEIQKEQGGGASAQSPSGQSPSAFPAQGQAQGGNVNDYIKSKLGR